MNEYIQLDNGQMSIVGNNKFIHNKLFSVISTNGNIIHFIQNYLLLLKSNNKETLCIIPLSNSNYVSNLFEFIKKAQMENKILIIGILGQKTEYSCINYLYLPFDDTFFKRKISFNLHNISWEDRKSTIFWRGSCNNPQNLFSVRVKMVKKLFNYLDSDVKFINYQNQFILKNYFDEKVHYSEFFKYKIIIIVDGDSTPSNYMWAFSTGCVPIIISNVTHWFYLYLQPYVHYVPVNYDLSNLIEIINWIRNNDIYAQQIAKNALFLSKQIFDPEFQKNYVKNSIENIIKINT